MIGASFLGSIWAQRNRMAFKGDFKKENVIFRDMQFLVFDWIRCRSKGGMTVSLDSWICNPANAMSSCIALASR